VHSKNRAGRIGAQVLTAICGLWLLFLAARASDAWIVRHVVLPNYFLAPTSLGKFHLARAVAALVGVVLAVLAPRVGRWVGAQSWRELAVAAAASD
jgi:hypothetical protein